MAVTTSCVFHWPKTTCLPSSHSVLAVQMKNGTVCVGSSICHRQDAGASVLQDKILIIKFLPVDGLAACAIVAWAVTTLAPQSWNNSVKAGAFITTSFLPSAQSMKVFCHVWDFVCKQLEGGAAQRLDVNSHVKEHSGVDYDWAREGPRQQRLQGPNLYFLIPTHFPPFSPSPSQLITLQMIFMSMILFLFCLFV